MDKRHWPPEDNRASVYLPFTNGGYRRLVPDAASTATGASIAAAAAAAAASSTTPEKVELLASSFKFDGSREPSIRRVAVSWGPEDQSILLGLTCIVAYIATWLLGVVVVPLIIILIWFGWYKTGASLFCLSFICFIFPSISSSRFRRVCRGSFGRFFSEASMSFEHVPHPQLDRPTILCVHPHGIFSMSWVHCYLTEELSHCTFCFSVLLRLNPLLRLLTNLLGRPSDAQRSTILRHMSLRRSIAIAPGAWHEATIHNSQQDRVFILERKGFIKYALQFGYTVTPSYCFGERETYCNVQGCYPFRFWLNDHKILATLPFGWAWCPFLPKPKRLHTVVGEPLQLPSIPKPTQADVQLWHSVYVERLTALFNRYRFRFYGKNAPTLEIW